jgi:hypothetical protein
MLRIGLASLGSLAVVLAACGTDASGIEGCRKIEEARCRRAQSCGVDLEHIVHVGTSPEDAVEGCIRYYREACLHGFVVQDPGPVAVQSCTDAVNSGSCDVVKAPESSSECGWLVPPPPTAAAADAGVDASVDATPEAAP